MCSNGSFVVGFVFLLPFVCVDSRVVSSFVHTVFGGVAFLL